METQAPTRPAGIPRDAEPETWEHWAANRRLNEELKESMGGAGWLAEDLSREDLEKWFDAFIHMELAMAISRGQEGRQRQHRAALALTPKQRAYRYRVWSDPKVRSVAVHRTREDGAVTFQKSYRRGLSGSRFYPMRTWVTP